jgi:hypothetical protein
VTRSANTRDILAAAEGTRPPQSIRLIVLSCSRSCRVDGSSNDANDHKVHIFEVIQAAFLEAGKELEDADAKKLKKQLVAPSSRNKRANMYDCNGSEGTHTKRG